MGTALNVVIIIIVLVVLWQYGAEISCFLPLYAASNAVGNLGGFVKPIDIWNSCDLLIP